MKIRIQFAKFGNMVFIGHLDVMRYFQKALRRAGFDLAYTQGFSPHPILSFAAPLGVGITSCGEYADLELNSSESSAIMLERLNAVMVPGMRILDFSQLPEDAPNAMSSVAAGDYCLTFREGFAPKDASAYLDCLRSFLSRDSIPVEKQTKKGSREVDLKPLVFDYCLREKSETSEGPAIFLQVSTGSHENLKPELVLDAFHAWESFPKDLVPFSDEPSKHIRICRLETYGRDAEGQLKPLREFGTAIV